MDGAFDPYRDTWSVAVPRTQVTAEYIVAPFSGATRHRHSGPSLNVKAGLLSVPPCRRIAVLHPARRTGPGPPTSPATGIEQGQPGHPLDRRHYGRTFWARDGAPNPDYAGVRSPTVCTPGERSALRDLCTTGRLGTPPR